MKGTGVYSETFRNSLGKTYYSVNISTIYGNKTCLVHRLVMDCFYPAKSEYEQKLDINHKDGDKHYNYSSYNDRRIRRIFSN